MSDIIPPAGRYLVRTARGEGASDKPSLQDVLDSLLSGYRLHSITPWATGSGFVQLFIVVFEREAEMPGRDSAERRHKK